MNFLLLFFVNLCVLITSVYAHGLPEPGICGIGLSNDRIVYGETTQIDEFPWNALLEYSKPNNQSGFHCGGVLISDEFVLTASHCVNGKDIPSTWDLTSVRLGEWDFLTEMDCEYAGDESDCAFPPLNILIEEKIPHQEYNPQTQLNDIALLKLKTTVEFTDFIKPICLLTSGGLNSIEFVALKVAGWGIMTGNESVSNIKKSYRAEQVNLNECQQQYNDQNITLTSNQFCAVKIIDSNFCRGDSGGPLVGFHRNFTFPYLYLTGIMSFGHSRCDINGCPTVYTNINSYRDWITSKIVS